MTAPASDSPVGWAVIGCGWVAQDFAIPAILADASSRLVAVCDRDASAMTGLPDGVARHADPAAMLADPAVEAVYVATPNHMHADHVEIAAAAGRHVLCEKPMAPDAAGARRIRTAVRRAGVAYATAYDQRHHPAHERLARMVADGALGTVTQARIHYACWLPPGWAPRNWRVDPARAGGGAGIDLAPHGADLLAHILGEVPEDITARLQRRVHAYAVDDGAVLTLGFPSGALATLHVGYNCPDTLPRRRLELIGTRAMAAAVDTMGQVAGGRLTLLDAGTGAGRAVAFDAAGCPFRRQVARFSRHLRGRAGPPGDVDRDLALTERLIAALAAAATPDTQRRPIDAA